MGISGAHSAEQDHFDLLPFITIMMCLLAAFLLVTLSMAAIHVGADAGEGWIPQRDTLDKTPVLIEWDGKSVVWHNEQGLQKIDDDLIDYVQLHGRWARIDPDGTGEYVSKVKPTALDSLFDFLRSHRETHYALLAVRPSGFRNFGRFAESFSTRDIEIGSEPIEQAKPVRLILPHRNLTLRNLTLRNPTLRNPTLSAPTHSDVAASALEQRALPEGGGP